MELLKFIKKLGLFMLPLAAFLTFLELKTREIPSSYDLKRKYFEKVVDDIEVLALGNSHMLHGIDPKFFSVKGFNLASGFQNFYYDKALVNKYIDKTRNLKLVFLSIDYISLYYRIEDAASWIDYGYRQAWGVCHPSVSAWDSRNFSKLMLYTPSKSIQYIIGGNKKVLAKNLKETGFNPEDTLYYKTISDQDGFLRANFHFNLIKPERLKESSKELEELIQLLQKRKIHLVLLAPPVYATYSNKLDSTYIRRTKNIIDNMIKIYGCTYKDYSADNRFDITDFYDDDHLSYRGAEKFTTILDSEFVKPFVKKNPLFVITQ